MATKVVIIDVDLGINVDDIVSEEIEKLTAAAKGELDAAIEMNKTVQKTKIEMDNKAKEAQDKLTASMDKVHNDLVAAGETGIAANTIMASLSGIIANASAFTLRMKTLLAQKGNQHIIKRIKINGEQHYVFKPFNALDPDA